MTPKLNKPAWRLARRLCAARPSHSPLPNVGLLADCLDRVARWERMAQRARARNWGGAGRICADRAHRALVAMRDNASRQVDKTADHPPTPERQTLAEVYADLVALVADGATIKDNTLSVPIGEVELEDIELGDFTVALDFGPQCLPERPLISVFADNAPDNSHDHIHPHVSGDNLCTGEGEHAIKLAAEQLRIADVVDVVDSILNTYNPDSAYHKLENWWGAPCDSCGDSVDEDDLSCCCGCGDALCESCYGSCSDCHDTLCSNCGTSCYECGDSICARCTHTCAENGNDYCASCTNDCDDCGKRFSDQCLNDNGVCCECQESRDESEEPEEDDESGPAGFVEAPDLPSA